MINIVNNTASSLCKYGNNFYAKSIPVNSKDNIRAMLSNVELGSHIVCPCDSADKALSMFLYGAETVTVYTENLLEIVLMDLKLNALLTLDFKEFKEFFVFNLPNHKINYKVFSTEIYDKIRPYLKNETSILLHDMANRGNGTGFAVRTGKIFDTQDLSLEILEEVNPLFNEDDFYKLKSIITKDKVNIIYGSIDDIIAKINHVNTIVMPTCEHTFESVLENEEIKDKCNTLIAYANFYTGEEINKLKLIENPRKISPKDKDAILIIK